MRKILMAVSALTVIMSLFFAGCGDKEDGKITTDASTTTTTTTTRTTTSATSMNEPSRTSDSTTDKENLEDKITSALTDLTTLMDD